jgi:hypothetical protein
MAQFERSLSQADQNGQQMKTPGHGRVGSEIHGIGFNHDTTTTIIDAGLPQLLRRLRILRLDPLH